MKELQDAAKLLNAHAPVDGPLGKERIVYVNQLEEDILKSLGGSGDIIIPEEGTPSYSQTERAKLTTPTQSRVLPEGYSGIRSYRVPTPPKAPRKSRNWWEEFKDDVLGIDDTKFLGIKKDTFVGKGLKKVGDDILGIDGKKTLGIKDSTIGDVAKFIAPMFGAPGWLAWAGMNAYEINEALEDADKYKQSLQNFGTDFMNNYDPRNYIGLRYSDLGGMVDYLNNKDKESGGQSSPKKTPEERAQERQRGNSSMQAIKNRINSVPSYSLFNNDGSRNWSEDGAATGAAIAVDMQSKGKAPIFDVNDASKTQSFFASPGDPDYKEGFSMGGQYNDPYPQYMRPAGDQIINTINETGTFFQDYGGTADQRMYDYQPILDRLKGMNLDAISTMGSIYDKDGGIADTFKGYNQQKDALSEQLKQLNTMTGADNQNNLNNYLNAITGIGTAYGNVGNAYNNVSNAYNTQGMQMQNAYNNRANALAQGAGGVANAYGGVANAYGGVGNAYGRVGNEYGNSSQAIRNYGDSLGKSVDEQVALTNQAFDAERGRALAQNRQGLNLANQGLRNLNSLSATGTGSTMANAMINARLGQEMAGNLADVEVDRYRRLAEINPAMADVLKKEQYARATDKDIAGAQQGVAAAQQGVLGAEQGVLGAQSLLQGLDASTNAALSGVDQATTAGINAANQGVNAQNEMVKKATQNALGAETRYNQGNQMNKAVASNIGIDKGMVDADSKLTSDIINTQLQNVSMIPYLGQQAAQLPNLQIEAGLSPVNPLMQYTSPFTFQGAMPSPVNTFNPQPAGGGMEWYDYAMMAPNVIGGINQGINQARNLFGV